MSKVKIHKRLFLLIMNLLIISSIIITGIMLLTNASGAANEVTYIVVNDWNSGATVSVNIVNNGTTAINDWTVTWTFPGNQVIGNLWNGTYTQSGSSVTVKNTAWNGNISPGNSISFGFNISYSGTNSKPTNITLNNPTANTMTTSNATSPITTTKSIVPSTINPTTSNTTGHVTYTLSKASNPTQEQLDAYNKITEAMDKAVSYYNKYTNITKQLNISYNPSVATADGNINGSIRFGSSSYMNYITAMHEISHTVGVGTSSKWGSLIQNGIYTGSNATRVLREITGDNSAEIHGDSQHFWPYGLNYTSEVKSEQDVITHCKIVNAMKVDGI